MSIPFYIIGLIIYSASVFYYIVSHCKNKYYLIEISSTIIVIFISIGLWISIPIYYISFLKLYLLISIISIIFSPFIIYIINKFNMIDFYVDTSEDVDILTYILICLFWFVFMFLYFVKKSLFSKLFIFGFNTYKSYNDKILEMVGGKYL